MSIFPDANLDDRAKEARKELWKARLRYGVAFLCSVHIFIAFFSFFISLIDKSLGAKLTIINLMVVGVELWIFISWFSITLASYVAENEREKIRRAKESIEQLDKR
ncbi:hypothetical protein [Oligella sp. HMSC09E12]|uniref:hypothetical protein n=1 Tax=Oligella sp. HMSC09E12 TaxID=1581147 RepID=UPI0008A3C594|nr:hypothetical protein [Oligella sp. HMSC09E12]OFV49726.1 hypothetical protein HMPREF3179_03705 [Oligella sp. HMSC09E12]